MDRFFISQHVQFDISHKHTDKTALEVLPGATPFIQLPTLSQLHVQQAASTSDVRESVLKRVRFGLWKAVDAEKVWYPERIIAMQNVLPPKESYWERARLIIKTLSVCAAPGSGSGLPCNWPV